MFWGAAAAAAFVLCAAKFITRRSGCPKADKLFRKLHAAAGGVLPAAACIHAARRLRSGNCGALTRVLGAVMLLGIAALMLSHFFSKRLGRAWLRVHRAATVVTGLCLSVHIFGKK